MRLIVQKLLINKGDTMKIFKKIILFLASIMITASAFAEPLLLTTYEAIPFMSEKNLGGDLKHGFFTDLISAGFDAVNIEYKIKYSPLKRCVFDYKKGKNDIYFGAIPAVYLAMKKEEVGLVVTGHYSMVFNYFKSHHKNGITFGDLGDMKEYTIGVRNGSSILPVLKKADLKFDTVPREENLIRMLHGKRFDVLAEFDLIAIFLTKTRFPESLSDLAHTQKVFGGDAGIVYRKGDKKGEKAAQLFEEGFKIIKKNGVYVGLAKKYFGDEFPRSILVKDMR